MLKPAKFTGNSSSPLVSKRLCISRHVSQNCSIPARGSSSIYDPCIPAKDSSWKEEYREGSALVGMNLRSSKICSRHDWFHKSPASHNPYSSRRTSKLFLTFNRTQKPDIWWIPAARAVWFISSKQVSLLKSKRWICKQKLEILTGEQMMVTGFTLHILYHILVCRSLLLFWGQHSFYSSLGPQIP